MRAPHLLLALTCLAVISAQAGTTYLGGTITTAGGQSYTSSVELTNDCTLISTGDGDIDFASIVDGPYSLTVDTAGTTTFDGAIGGTIPLDNLAVYGVTHMGAGAVTTVGSQDYHDVVTLTDDTVLSADSVTFQDHVQALVAGTAGLTINASLGSTEFQRSVGTAILPLSSLWVGGLGGVTLGDDVYTTGSQTYNASVTLNGNVTLTSFSGNISFLNYVDGSYHLNVDVPILGLAQFDGGVGDLTPLNSLTVNGPANLGGGRVTTTGSQTYYHQVQLGANTTLEGDPVAFLGDVLPVVADFADLGVDVSSGICIFHGSVGSAVLPLSSLTVSGQADIRGGSVTTSGSQVYDDEVELNDNTALTGTTLDLEEVTGNSYDLSLHNSGDATLNGTVSGVDQLVAGGSRVLLMGVTVSASSVSVNSGASLAGNGQVNAPVVVNSGATLSPGTSIGLLTASKSLTLSGTAFMEVNKSGITNDIVQGMTNITYGGLLSVTNLSGTLAAGDAFALFNSTDYDGAFASLDLPPLSNGLVWSSSGLPSNGVIEVVQSPPPHITGIEMTGPDTVELTGTGVAHQAYWVYAATNLVLPKNEWRLVGVTNANASGIITCPDPNASNTTHFYQFTQ